METQTINFVKLIEHQTWAERVNRQAWMESRDDAPQPNPWATGARTTGKPTMLVTLRPILKAFRSAYARP